MPEPRSAYVADGVVSTQFKVHIFNMYDLVTIYVTVTFTEMDSEIRCEKPDELCAALKGEVC